MDTRCASRCQVVHGQWKRCIRPPGHDPNWERHLWVEAFDRSDGYPQAMVWDGDVAETPAATYNLHVVGAR